MTDLATSTPATLDVSPLTIERVDSGADRVTGQAAPFANVAVFLGAPIEANASADADATGSWTADFLGRYDIKQGVEVEAQVRDDQWDTTSVRPTGCPTHAGLQCTVTVSIEADSITLYWFTPDSDVDFEVFDKPPSRGGKLVYGPVRKRTDSQPGNPGVSGYYMLDFGLEPGDPNLEPDNYVVVTDRATGTVKSVELIALSIDQVEPELNFVAGRAPPPPPETVVQLSAMDRTLTNEQEVGLSGTWRFDVEVSDQDWFLAHARDEDRDETLDDRGAPVPGCVPGPETVCGTAGEDTLRVAGGGSFALLARPPRRLRVNAGLRNDTILLRLRRSGPVAVDAGPGSDAVLLDPRANPRTSSRVVVDGRAGNDLVILPAQAGNLRVRFVGGSGDDRVQARRLGAKGASRGGYRLEGGRGNDRLVGGSGKDVLIGGPGRDVCFKGRNDTVRSCEIVRRGGGR